MQGWPPGLARSASGHLAALHAIQFGNGSGPCRTDIFNQLRKLLPSTGTSGCMFDGRSQRAARTAATVSAP